MRRDVTGGVEYRGAGGLLRDQRGNVVVLFALLLPVLLGMGALAVDGAHLYVIRTQLQTVADAAVLAAVQELPDANAARVKAKQYALKNAPWEAKGELLKSEDVEVGYWDAASRTFTADTGRAEAVRVTVRRAGANGNPVPTFFAGLFGVDAVDVAAEAVAGAGVPTPCLLALEPTKDKGVEISGGGAIIAPGCLIQANSTSSKAINLSGGSTISAETICVGGGASGSGYSPAAERCDPMPDPLAGLPPPSVGGCDYTGTSFGGITVTLWPGVYCGGISMSGGGKLIFEPGVYVMKDGPLTTSGGSTIEGEGVGFYLTGTNAYVNVSGGGGVELSAPTSGPLAGMIFFQGADAPAGAKSHFSGGSDSHYQGVLYFPTQELIISGGGSATFVPPVTIAIARRFTFSGGSVFNLRSDYASSSVPAPAGLGGSGKSHLLR